MSKYYADQQKAMHYLDEIVKRCIKDNTPIDVELLGFQVLRKYPVSAKFVEKYLRVLEREYAELEELTEWPL